MHATALKRTGRIREQEDLVPQLGHFFREITHGRLRTTQGHLVGMSTR